MGEHNIIGFLNLKKSQIFFELNLVVNTNSNNLTVVDIQMRSVYKSKMAIKFYILAQCLVLFFH